MAGDSKKPFGGVLVTLGKKGKGVAAPAEDSPKRNAAKGVLDAVKAGNVADLEDALDTFIAARAPVDD